jgi:hypothetical protein
MVKLFFSYSHKDETLRDELENHLTILRRKGIIDVWHDRRIEPGANLSSEINANLRTANIILLLLSSDFLASDYCYDIEMKEAMRRHENSECAVIPVVLRPCDWHDTPFGKLIAVPRDGKAVIKFSSYDEAFLEITNEIKRVVERISKTKEPVQEVAREETRPTSPRSSNLRIKKGFSDHEKDKFLDDAFDYIANYFEASLQELKKRNPQIEYRFKRVDSQTFTASLYIDGKSRSECMIYLGGMLGSKSISYSRQISASRNQLNESLTIIDNGYILQLKPLGMSFRRPGESKSLTNEGSAEYFWEIFVESLQRG